MYAALWQQQQSFIEGGSFGGASGGIFKSTDGGTTWQQLTEGLPTVLQANLAIATSDPKTIYATVAGAAPGVAAAPVGFGGGVIGFYKSSDARRTLDARQRRGRHRQRSPTIVRWRASAAAICRSSPSIRRTRTWFTPARLSSGARRMEASTWSAVRGAPGGDDYQQMWINPNDPNILILVSDQGGVVSANRGASWSNWYTQPTAAMYHVSTDNTFVYRVCGGQQDSGSACVDSRSMDGEITFHDWHPVNIQEYGIAAPDPRDPDLVFGSERQGVSLYNRHTGQTTHVGPDMAAKLPNGGAMNRNVRTMPINWSPVDERASTSRTSSGRARTARTAGRASARISRARRGRCRANAGKYAADVKPAPSGTITAFSPSPRSHGVLWAGTDDGQIQTTDDFGAHWTNVTPAAIKPWTRIFNIEAGHFDDGTAYAAANTFRVDDNNPHFWRTHDGGRSLDRDQQWHRARRRHQLDSRRSPKARAALRVDRRAGLGVVRRRRSLGIVAAQHAGYLGARSPGQGRFNLHLRGSRSPAHMVAVSGFSTT